MVRCHDTSSRSKRPNEKEKEKISSDLAGGGKRLTHSIVVEPVLSEEHLPKVLADLVPCLSSSYRVVNDRRSAQREKRPFGTHLASLPYANKTEQTEDVVSEFL